MTMYGNGVALLWSGRVVIVTGGDSTRPRRRRESWSIASIDGVANDSGGATEFSMIGGDQLMGSVGSIGRQQQQLSTGSGIGRRRRGVMSAACGFGIRAPSRRCGSAVARR